LYILLCDQKTYYVGLTLNVQNRFKSHKAKENIATKKFSDLVLVYTEEYKTKKEAIKKLSSSKVDDREIIVNEARPREERPSYNNINSNRNNRGSRGGRRY
jgi:predicted GIY-YIG superfamily endonuclease